MNNFTCYVGEQIRKYRKAGKMTLQILADAMPKVELPYANMKMEISPLISKLYMRSAEILQVSMSQLTTGIPETASK